MLEFFSNTCKNIHYQLRPRFTHLVSSPSLDNLDFFRERQCIQFKKHLLLIWECEPIYSYWCLLHRKSYSLHCNTSVEDREHWNRFGVC